MKENAGPHHPLALELGSLRNAVTHYQHGAHVASVHLQRQALDITVALEKARFLEQQNDQLHQEARVLRANLDTSPGTSELQMSEMSLALRRANERLSLMENKLLERTTELGHALAGKAHAEAESQTARDLISAARAREEAALALVRDKEQLAKKALEERNMSDLAVQEYADLVKNLEGRSSSSTIRSIPLPNTDGAQEPSHTASSPPIHPSTAPIDTLMEGRLGLRKLLHEMNVETNRLQIEIQRVHGQLETCELRLASALKTGEEARTKLALAQVELEQYKADDSSAAKLVTRYMSFSQSSTNILQSALSSAKVRHAATSSALSAHIAQLERVVNSERAHSEHLRSALDELTEDISRESYGRRREIALRLSLLAREEKLVEALNRWQRKATETLHSWSTSHHEDDEFLRKACASILANASSVLVALDGVRTLSEVGAGSLGRIIAAEEAVSSLNAELQTETEKRMALERERGRIDPSSINEPLVVVTPPNNDAMDKERLEFNLSKPEPMPRPPAQISPIPMSMQTEPTPTPISTQTQIIPALSTTLPPIQAPVGIQIPLLADELPSDPAPDPRTRTPDPTASLTLDDQVPTPPTIPSPLHAPETIAFPGTDNSPSPIPPPESSPRTPTLEVDLVSGIHVEINHGTTTPTQSEINLSPREDVIPPTNGDILPPPSENIIDAAKTGLLRDIDAALHCYDGIQRAFRDCHSTLSTLQTDLDENATHRAHPTMAVLKAAIERLNDFNEDVRVGIEIRISDEARVAQGFKTLLELPDILAHPSREDLVADIEGFADSASEQSSRIMEGYKHKLDDLLHDIAAVKLAVHELSFTSDGLPVGLLADPPPGRPSWPTRKWSSYLPTTPPRPSSPAQTFGSVMTSHAQFPRYRSPSSPQAESVSNPFERFGFRIPMPSHAMGIIPSPATPQSRSRTISTPTGLGTRFPGGRPGERPRAVSGLFALGFGGPSSHSGLASRPLAESGVAATPDEELEAETETEGESDAETDIEPDTDVE